MSFYKVVLYFALIFVFYFLHIGIEAERIFFFIFLGLIYFDARDPNIRSLVVVIAMVEFLFYEIDYLLYVLGKYYWDTGSIVGDIILDIVIVMSIMCTMMCVYYRSEIMDTVRSWAGLEHFDYLPTRADIAVINTMRLIGLYHVVMLLINASVVYEYNIAVESAQAIHISYLKERIIDLNRIYVEWGFNIALLKYFALVFSLHAWMKKDVNTKRPKLGLLKG
ncbi:hypothetical protein [Alteromonas sp. ASW11-130]|uniref:hypothetical protein n=1 Tax=Alteromonas sp. ASW11-130 TaxID=3015775 RepID=UPI0022425038|nr:hypothetical protein [Alteromonas sp. ASW11-130]MCW8092481.1 hypothetical protein [Alteromonas sp. ASW11-130]